MFLLRISLSFLFAASLAACSSTVTTTAAFGPMPSGFETPNAELQILPVVNKGSMPVGADTPPPMGYVGFCRRYPADCTGSTSNPRPHRLTEAAWRELDEVNAHVNRTVQPVEDADLYNKPEWWTYPDNNSGDCEDYVLLKRRILIERGWSPNTLLISVVRERNGDGHAVLLVVTDQGEYVLDNKTRRIVAWQDTPYTWVKRQSQQHPYVWVRAGQASGGNRAALDVLEFFRPVVEQLSPELKPIADEALRPSLS